MRLRVVVRIATVLALAATAALPVACAQPQPEPTPSPTPTQTPAPTTPEIPHEDLTVGYFLDGQKVAAVRLPGVEASDAKGTLEALVSGVPTEAVAADFTTAIPQGTEVLSVSVAAPSATVDLSRAFGSGGGSLSIQARVAQVVFTLTRFPGVERVTLLMDGKPIEGLGGEGLVLTEPQTREDYEDLSPEVLIESPVLGDTVSDPVEVSGTANVFEAVFAIEVEREDGTVVSTQRVMATSGTGTRGTFSASVPLALEPGDLASLVAVYGSPKDGSRVVAGRADVVVR